MYHLRLITAASLGAILGGSAACAQQAPTDEPTRPGVVDPVPEEGIELAQMIQDVGEIRTVDDLLDALESADADLKTFRAEVKWDRRFRLQGDRHIRFGELFFEVEPESTDDEPRRTFAVRFDELLIDDVLREVKSQWVFDGVWLYEKDFKEMTFIARRLAREGERIDPLQLGEGPIPLPIGQKKDDILHRYEAELLPAADGLEASEDTDPEEASELEALRGFVADAHQLRLVPREWFSDESEFREIRLWYQRGALHPRMAMTINRTGDDSKVQLINIRTNQPLPEGSIQIDPPREEDGWRVEIDQGRFTANNEPEGEGG